MASIAQGYWIAPTGEPYRTPAHIIFMVEHPELFSLTKTQQRKLGEYDPNFSEEMIMRALKLGWIRVMGGPPTFYYEVWELTPTTLGNIIEFVRALKIPEDTIITMSESGVPLAERPELHFPVSELYGRRIQTYLRNPRSGRRSK